MVLVFYSGDVLVLRPVDGNKLICTTHPVLVGLGSESKEDLVSTDVHLVLDLLQDIPNDTKIYIPLSIDTSMTPFTVPSGTLTYFNIATEFVDLFTYNNVDVL